MNDELMNDELPSPPAGVEAEPISDEMDASLLTAVPKMGEAMPAGTYSFRLEKYYEQWQDKDFDGKAVDPKEPSFGLQWRCQEEPHVGKVVLENVEWVRTEMVQAANDPQNPQRASAQSYINKRLPRAKEIMTAAGFQPSGKFGFKDFMGTNPEMKLQLNVKEKKGKSPDGKWVGTGEFKNGVIKHLSLARPQ